MSVEMKTSYGSTTVLLLLGVLALSVSTGWLMVLVPAALLVWFICFEVTGKSSRG